MTSKLKQSIAIQRNIPEHIRTNYPLFVEFIKSYYDYLEQTQLQDLESARDIDSSLDLFISHFTAELSANFPINLVSDKASILKHLRDFYLSRGSEASYKFLFRVLFGKEASLYYPSTQMLRVSDGRWKQDVSIFVIPTDISMNIAALAGKIIRITNSHGKIIKTVAERVVQYAPTIYEVFIERDYVNEINVGATIEPEDSSVSARIIQCPTTVKVYKSGKGFKVGAIYALKTQLGRGCVIKITSVDSEGAIQKIQVMSFGLDYKTKFYSYISTKENAAYEYVHPLQINGANVDNKMYTATSGQTSFDVEYIVDNGHPLVYPTVVREGMLLTPVPAFTAVSGHTINFNSGLLAGDMVFITGVKSKTTTGYIDPYSGFLEYGWATKQTYMDYDASIPVGREAWASDRYFADPGYVGEALVQFYNDGAKPIDTDIAIIEIDLGAVAKYPGYYMTADGFISDEMFIQDGDYRQLFSYVVRVEEELRRYVDVVKALVHPVGMKIFSEYNIFNVVKLVSTQPKSIANIFTSSALAGISDRGYNYSDYTREDYIVRDEIRLGDVIDGAGNIYKPTTEAQRVYSARNMAARYSFKNIRSSAIANSLCANSVGKSVSDTISDSYERIETSNSNWTITRNYSELISKPYYKNPTDILSEYLEAISEVFFKDIADINNVQSGLSVMTDKRVTDAAAVGTISLNANGVNKQISDTISQNYIEFINEQYYKNPVDTISEYLEAITEVFFKGIADINNVQSGLSVMTDKRVADAAAVGTIGNIRLAPYDIEGYFEYHGDYQASTPIS